MSHTTTSDGNNGTGSETPDALDESLDVGDTFEWTTGLPGEVEIIKIWLDVDLTPQVRVKETGPAAGDGEERKRTLTPDDLANVIGSSLKRT